MASIRFVGMAVGLSLVLAAGTGCGGSKQEAKSPAGGGAASNSGPAEVGKPAPDLSIQTLNGKGKVTLESLQGKIVIVDFWATWCGPCKQSFPKLEELSKKLGNKVEIIGVSVDDSSDGVLEFAKENKATFAIGWDEGHDIANRWKVGTMPTTYILDGSGTVRFIHDGYHDGETDVMAKEVATIESDGPAPTKDKGEKVAANETKPVDSGDSGDKSATADPPAKETAAPPPDEEPVPVKPKKAGKGRAGGKKGGKRGKKK